MTPLVPLNNRDGGLAEHASKLAVGKVSTVFRSTTGDGYYVVKLLQREGDRISYSALKIALTEFQSACLTSSQIIKYRNLSQYLR